MFDLIKSKIDEIGMFLICVEIVKELGFCLVNVVEEYFKVLVCK